MAIISSFLILVYFFSTSLYGVNGDPCIGTDISCNFNPTNLMCTINSDDAIRASYLINKCTTYINTYPGFQHVYVITLVDQQTITLDIAPGVTKITLLIYGNNAIVFNNTQPDITDVTIFSYFSLNASKDFLSDFHNLQFLFLDGLSLDGIPVFSSNNLETIYLFSLKLPIVGIIDSSKLNQPNLTILTLSQTYDAQWFSLADNAFDKATNIVSLGLNGLQHCNSFQFANLVFMTRLVLSVDSHEATFEENAFSGLNELSYLSIHESVNIDFLLDYTFPKLEDLYLNECQLTTLDQGFFHRQKTLDYIEARNNPLNCNCDLSWVNHAVHNLGWTIEGTCSTPFHLNGNAISYFSNYNNCPETSFDCFNETFICPIGFSCFNTADGAYCDCYKGYELQTDTNTCIDIDECSNITNVCQHICTNTPGSYKCSCHNGYALFEDLFTCVDIDECSLPILYCEQVCTNILGSYNCSCTPGHTLGTDLSTCSSVSQLTSQAILSILMLMLLFLC